MYTGRFVAITSTSTSTSTPYYTGDFRLITVSFLSSDTSPSRFTIQGSNADGFQVADLGGATSNANWSLVSGVNMIGVTPGMVTLDPPGYRWLRITVDPSEHQSGSSGTIIIAGRT